MPTYNLNHHLKALLLSALCLCALCPQAYSESLPTTLYRSDASLMLENYYSHENAPCCEYTTRVNEARQTHRHTQTEMKHQAVNWRAEGNSKKAWRKKLKKYVLKKVASFANVDIEQLTRWQMHPWVRVELDTELNWQGQFKSVKLKTVFGD